MMSIIKFPRNHNNKAPQKIIICREFSGPIDRRWKESKKAQITVNALGRKRLAREGEGRRTPRPSSVAKRRLKSQLRRIFAELLGSYQCGFCTQEEAMSITCFILCRLSTYLVKVCRSKPLVKKSDTVISSKGEGSCCQ